MRTTEALRAGDVERDPVACAPGPLDAERVEGVGVQAADVGRDVGEEVPGIFVALEYPADAPLGPIGDAAAVGVDEAPDERPGVSVDDRLLPRIESDPAIVLFAGAVLREEAGPVSAVADHGRVSDGLDPVGLAAGIDGLDRGSARIDEAGPRVGAGNPEEVARPCAGADAAIAEIETEQVGVCRPVLGWLGRRTAERAEALSHAWQRLDAGLPGADGGAGYAGFLADRVQAPPLCHQGQCSRSCAHVVHAATLRARKHRHTAKNGCSRERGHPLADGNLGNQGKVPRVGLEPTLYGF